MKYFSTFTGIGGFELGIINAYAHHRTNKEQESGESSVRSKRNSSDNQHRTGRKESPECVGFSEIDKYANQTYSKHFPQHKNYGDITTLDPKDLPDFDFLVGGFPCQAFSIAGKRGGFEDTRGTLFYEVARILREKLPRLILLENVKGLLSHDGGRTFKTIITTLAELGYAVEWQVLNAKDYGVPQNRERVYIVGHLGGFRGREIFPITGGHEEYPNKANVQGRASTLTGRSAGGQNRRGNYIVVPEATKKGYAVAGGVRQHQPKRPRE